MDEIKIRGRAKINLSLDVLRRREDGYHEVKMIMQQIDLYDEILLKNIDKGILLESNCEFIPTHEGNIAYKAAKLMMEKFHVDRGVHIYIDKKIPVAAGLAGGSTDAAAVMIGLNKLWGINATKEELMEASLSLGADVPFCILGGAALAEGIGEKLTPIRGINEWVVLCKPNISVSTASVYGNLDVSKIRKHPNTDIILNALENQDLQSVVENLCNVLEPVTESMHPIVKDIKRKMLEYHAWGSLMSGSGPTVFGIYKDYNKAKSAYENLSKVYNQVYLVKTYDGRGSYDHK
ncbi:4-(cytidine 5'-diphospho)-2-C-methyl-D-erythritol kinase [Crassaminicella thermophila]|uniref:4-diphosphocytidyl-2-C-methyl-D-erythritol kinase n=1 Tax=Crassaminicella thermophila TaxID=2599308 RepID=A0A5C0SHW8_CRATE|nr:4-(cytidine 5'-diphospho)-2-C-methyl-D-erythritol kinase [Crassaminicella thermophila]QEK13277.1 4-(cytidine 5'-diphospho)-2-C-methyl-D-erythritol kinase [Crassaminicella thermophila]